MSIVYSKCFKCKNYFYGKFCFAFPEGIPDNIFMGGELHQKKVKGQFGDYTFLSALKSEGREDFSAFMNFVVKYKLAYRDAQYPENSARLLTDKAYYSLCKELPMTNADKLIMKKYISSSYSMYLNSGLRGKDKMREEDNAYIKKLDAVFPHYSLPFGILVKRYVSLDSFNQIFGGSEGESREKVMADFMQNNGTIKDASYISTSCNSNLFSNDGIEMNIVLPKGSHVIVPFNAAESEITLPRNAKIKVNRYEVKVIPMQEGVSQERVFIYATYMK